MSKNVQILLVEDNPEYRNVLEVAIKRDPNFELSNSVGTAERAIGFLQVANDSDKPDIILLDLALPGISGLEAIPSIQNHASDAKIIILTQSESEADVLTAISQGVSGYLLKSATVQEIKDGIQNVMNGGASLDPGMAKFILKTIQTITPKSEDTNILSERELEVLRLLADGLVKKEIAAKLNISFFTVATHIRHVYEKLNVINAPSAVSKAYKTGLFSA